MRLCNVKNVVAALIDCSKRQQLQLQATLDHCCHADVSVGLLSALVEVDSSLLETLPLIYSRERANCWPNSTHGNHTGQRAHRRMITSVVRPVTNQLAEDDLTGLG